MAVLKGYIKSAKNDLQELQNTLIFDESAFMDKAKAVYRKYKVDARFSELELNLNGIKPFFFVGIYPKSTKSNYDNYITNYKDIVDDLCNEFESVAKAKDIKVVFKPFIEPNSYPPQTPGIVVE